MRRSRGLGRQRWMRRATPVWADRSAMRRLYCRARRCGLVVDHIVPLNHSNVCGLHCEANLQLLTPEQNMFKSNHWWPDMWGEPAPLIPCSLVEQYELAL